jgi:hypothetical protein
VRLPITYQEASGFGSWHTASLEAVAALLPSPVLHPARWFDGRGLVSVDVFRYREATWTADDGRTRRMTPYGEVGVSVGVTRGAAPRGLPALRDRVGGLVVALPVTTREARDAGRELWGLPKSTADMEFEEAPGRQEVRVAEDGAVLLELAVAARGPLLPTRRRMTVYSSRDGELLETVVPVRGLRQVRPGTGAGRLTLGDHPVAELLHGLGISPAPIAGFRWAELRSTLPAGRPVGPAGPVPCHAGSDRELGRWTVRHPGTEPLDQYAVSAPAGR